MRSVKAKLFLQYTLPKKALTVFGGLLANVKVVWVKNYLIRYFLKNHDVNMQEAIHESIEAYISFNDFFTRHLKSGLRPIAATDIVSPVDGFVSEFGRIEKGQLLQAKGKYYSVQDLLAVDKAQSDVFEAGSFATLYLSPKDYHRVHMPLAGQLQQMTHVPGTLFSVQPATTRHIPKLFARNERLVLLFETELGPVAVVFVGATVVGAIGTCWQGDLPRPRDIKSYDDDVLQWSDAQKTLKKADELGYFKLGSTVILLFAANVNWTPALKAGMSIRLGAALGDVLGNSIKEQ
ncbi:MAG: archaetidylserine decarboxylase [Gammaproteobacteria bacterium]|nr:archaetidylserine decarboxylase [Gammaproteobacteria bacterium]